jgi:outer membrane biosynthesis protein TonB
MTPGLPRARLPAAFAVSLAVHAALGAALAAAVTGWQPGAPPAIRPDALFATLRVAPTVEARPKRAPARPRPIQTAHDASNPGGALPKPYYYRSSELTERPAPLAPIDPQFPPGAPGSGRLKMRLYINENGLVDAVDIIDAEPAGVFEESAAQAFTAARFRPGHKDSSPVKSQIALEVRFGEPLPLAARRPQ